MAKCHHKARAKKNLCNTKCAAWVKLNKIFNMVSLSLCFLSDDENPACVYRSASIYSYLFTYIRSELMKGTWAESKRKNLPISRLNQLNSNNVQCFECLLLLLHPSSLFCALPFRFIDVILALISALTTLLSFNSHFVRSMVECSCNCSCVGVGVNCINELECASAEEPKKEPSFFLRIK